MEGWNELRTELLRLQDREPSVLMRYPNPNGDDDHEPPFHISLDPGAVDVAQDLHQRFGEQVRLRLGALPYPPRPAGFPDLEPWYQPTLREPVALDHQLDGIRVELDGPLTVTSGDAAQHGVLITNESAAPLSLHTNGHLTAQIVDLSDGSHVGGDTRPARMPLVTFPIAPGATTRVPLIVGTTSFVPQLGYAIPPGRWGLTVNLKFGDQTALRSPVLSFDVVAAA